MNEAYDRVIIKLIFMNEIDLSDEQEMDEEILRLLPIHGEFIKTLAILSNKTLAIFNDNEKEEFNVTKSKNENWFYEYFTIESFDDFMNGTFDFIAHITVNDSDYMVHVIVENYRIKEFISNNKNLFNVRFIHNFKIVKEILMKIEDGAKRTTYIYEE